MKKRFLSENLKKKNGKNTEKNNEVLNYAWEGFFPLFLPIPTHIT